MTTTNIELNGHRGAADLALVARRVLDRSGFRSVKVEAISNSAVEFTLVLAREQTMLDAVVHLTREMDGFKITTPWHCMRMTDDLLHWTIRASY